MIGYLHMHPEQLTLKSNSIARIHSREDDGSLHKGQVWGNSLGNSLLDISALVTFGLSSIFLLLRCWGWRNF